MEKEIFTLKCKKCGIVLPESEIQESHDVPKYIFNGDKNQADKWGRHYLCKKCHDIYERIVPSIIISNLDQQTKEIIKNKIKSFSLSYFKNGDNNDKRI